MKRLFRLVLCLSLTLPAFGQAVCDKTVAISVAAGSTATIAPAVPNQSVRICGFVITGNTANTGFQFVSNSVNLTGVMYTAANGSVAYVSNTPTITGVNGYSVTMSCGTGTCTGFASFTQY